MEFECNDKFYKINKTGLIACIDGTEPAYIECAIKRGLMPNWKIGYKYNAKSDYPTLTNVNNISIITGVNSEIHGINGNSVNIDGKDILMNDSKYIKCPTILEVFSKKVNILIITVKNKLFKLLSKGLNEENSLVISIEDLSVDTKNSKSYKNLKKFNLLHILENEEHIPTIYEYDASLYCFKLALKILKSKVFNPKVIYISTTDLIQHKNPPDSNIANYFYNNIDIFTKKFTDLNIRVGMTADHGMNKKTNIVFIQDVLESLNIKEFELNRSIKDPYLKHHDSIGSHMRIFIKKENEREKILNELNSLKGVTANWSEKENCIVLDGDKITAFGTRKVDHNNDIIKNLRTHGGSSEQIVPIYLSDSSSGVEMPVDASNIIVQYNYDIFSFIFN